MRRSFVIAAVLGASALAVRPSLADGPCTPGPAAAPQTWGASTASTSLSTTSRSTTSDESPVAHARDLLARARLLDEAATSDEKTANELATRIPALRASAKAARDRADRAAGDDREALVSRAEDLEADLAVSEAEASAKRRSAVENRRVARELRARAVRTVREAPIDPPAPTASCDPPYRFTADGRRIYRIECLK